MNNKTFKFFVFSSIFCFIATLSFYNSAKASVQCLDQNQKPVDWWVIVKLPRDISPNKQKYGESYYYLDATDAPAKFYSEASDRNIYKSEQALAYTVSQIYHAYNNKSPDVGWVMYNDSVPYYTNKKGDPIIPPEEKPPYCFGGPNNTSYTHHCGHTKGTLAFDGTTGFWLIHSITNFPLSIAQTNSYKYFSSTMYGQSALCISLSITHNGTKQFDNIGKQLKYANPAIYDQHIPDEYKGQLPNLEDVIAKRNITIAPNNRTELFYSIKGKQFVSVVQTNTFLGPDPSQTNIAGIDPNQHPNPTPFYQLVADIIHQHLSVQSWLNGNTPFDAICDYSQYRVSEIKSLATNKLSDGTNPPSSWSTKIDHAKWATGIPLSLSDTSHIVCIGDINNTVEQQLRGGGAACFDDANTHAFLSRMITSSLTCPSESNDNNSSNYNTNTGEQSSSGSSNNSTAIVAGTAAILGSAALIVDHYFSN